MTQIVRSTVEARGSTRVPPSVVGKVDPANDAVRWARRSGRTPTSPDVEQYEYEAHSDGASWVVVTTGRAGRVELDDRGRPTPPRQWFDRGNFEEVELMDWSARDLATALAERHTVAELRDARRRAGASFERGSTKRQMAKQLAAQAPDEATRMILGSRRSRGL